MFRSIVIIIGLLFLNPLSAGAHSSLKESNPSDGQVIQGEGERIRLMFDAPVKQTSTLNVTAKDGEEVEIGRVMRLGNELSAVIEEELTGGEYVIGWTMISADGHPIEGTVDFTVKGETTIEQPIAPAESEQAVDQREEQETTATGNEEKNEASVMRTSAMTQDETPTSSGFAATLLPWVGGGLVATILTALLFLFARRRSA